MPWNKKSGLEAVCSFSIFFSYWCRAHSRLWRSETSGLVECKAVKEKNTIKVRSFYRAVVVLFESTWSKEVLGIYNYNCCYRGDFRQSGHLTACGIFLCRRQEVLSAARRSIWFQSVVLFHLVTGCRLVVKVVFVFIFFVWVGVLHFTSSLAMRIVDRLQMVWWPLKPRARRAWATK